MLLAVAGLGSGCASAANQGASTSTTTKSSTHHNSAKTDKKTTSSKVIFTQSLSGSKHTKKFTAKKSWQLSYYYNCSGKRGSFTLYLKPKHGHSIKVTSQSGLGGGGTRTYAHGTYSLSATTTCKWTVKATKATPKKH